MAQLYCNLTDFVYIMVYEIPMMSMEFGPVLYMNIERKRNTGMVVLCDSYTIYRKAMADECRVVFSNLLHSVSLHLKF